VLFPDVPSEAITATVYREAGGRTSRVRGGIRTSAVGGFGLVDFEAPFQITTAYYAVFYDGAGVELEVSDRAETRVDAVGTCVHQPLDPWRMVMGRILALAYTAESLSREFLGEVVRPQGRSVPVWIGSGRTGLTDVAFPFATYTADEEQAMVRVFGEYEDDQLPVVCIRSSHNLGIPPTFFGVVRKPVRKGWDQHVGGEVTLWDLTATEVAPPAEALIVARLTYGDLEAFYDSYTAFEGAYSRYLGAETDFALGDVVA